MHTWATPARQTPSGWPVLQAILMRDVMFTFMKRGDDQRKARVVAYFGERIHDPRARDMLPRLLGEFANSPMTTICPQGLVGAPQLVSINVQRLTGSVLCSLSPTVILHAHGSWDNLGSLDSLCACHFRRN